MEKDIDSVGRLSRVVWATSQQREGAIRYGDAIIMDTTFLTNKYAVCLSISGRYNICSIGNGYRFTSCIMSRRSHHS